MLDTSQTDLRRGILGNEQRFPCLGDRGVPLQQRWAQKLLRKSLAAALSWVLFVPLPTLWSQEQGVAGGPRLIAVRPIWDRAPHNAFTDLIRFQDRWFCVFREGQTHVSPDGALRVLMSNNGVEWESVALMKSEDSDLRDAKLSVTPDGILMLCGAEALHDRSEISHHSLAWYSHDGMKWSEATRIGEPDLWLWRVAWHGRTGYGIGYRTTSDRGVRLYQSGDGRAFEVLVPDLGVNGYPNESAMVFVKDQAICLLRRDGQPNEALLGIAGPPYTQWQWRSLGVAVGGPCLLQIPDGRLVAAVRRYEGGTRTALCWLDPQEAKLVEFLKLPSGGDCSYPGMVWHEGRLWVSYYSSHEGQARIYLATVAFDEDGDAEPMGDHRLPLSHAHAHNDYYHERPLRDALDAGFTSVEADVFLIDGELLVGHSRKELTPTRTLEALYLKPLAELAAKNQGAIFPSAPEQPFWLHLDIKSEAKDTYLAIQQTLARYETLLNRETDQQFQKGPVQVVISGNRDYGQIVGEARRLAGIDGRFTDLGSDLTPRQMPLLSDSWWTHFKWNGIGEMPKVERETLRRLVRQAHAEGRKVRFWATPENEGVWRELLEAEVDFINTDQLEQLECFLSEEPAMRVGQ